MRQYRTIMQDLAAAVADHPRDIDAQRNATRAARHTFRALSIANGGGRNPYLLTAQEQSTKLSHNATETAYRQSVMYLAPAGKSGIANVCPWSTAGCRALCLDTSGRLGMTTAQTAMKVRVHLMVEHPAAFIAILADETRKHAATAQANGATYVLRLNGTSDIPFDQIPGLYELLTGAGVERFQDYTKRPAKVRAATLHPDWSLTPSATERTRDYIPGMAVVVNVHRDAPLPDTFHGLPVIDGDNDHGDLRILDKVRRPDAVVLLRAKGKARKAGAGSSKFVKDIATVTA